MKDWFLSLLYYAIANDDWETFRRVFYKKTIEEALKSFLSTPKRFLR